MDIEKFEVICNILLLLITHLFLNSLLTKRYNRWLTWWLQLLHTMAVPLICGFWLPKGSLLCVLISPVTLILFVFVMYRERPWTCLLLTLFYGLAEFIAVTLFYPSELVAQEEGIVPVMQLIAAFLPLFLATVFILWLIYLGLRRMQDKIGVHELLLYAGFPVSQFLLFYGWNRMMQLSAQSEMQSFLMVVLVICVGADIALFISMSRLLRQKELEAENRMLARQIQAQKEHYSELTAQYDSIRRMRHDIAKHINAMDSLLTAGRSEEAAAYVSELRAMPYDASLGICEHPVVDAFLHNAIQSASAAGVEVQASVSVPADVDIADTDLVCSFGNLLDNAVEACMGQEGAVIRMESYVAGGCLVITAENPVFPEKQAKKALIPGLQRGVGMRVLGDLAEKYGGRFSYEQDGEIFRAEIIYKLGVK